MTSTWLGIVLCGALLCRGDELPPGHLQPLGSHREPHLVTRLATAPTSSQFYHEYVHANLPVLFEGLLNSTQLLQTWGSDQYLREQFGEDEVSVEHKKKENRSSTGFLTTMADYLDRYGAEDVYMVTPLTVTMQQEWLLPHFVLCGGFTDNLIFSYMWFSSGGTSSVLHTDAFENLHCLVSGVKEFVLIEPQYTDTVGPEHERQGYYNLDVDSVDMLSRPGLVSVPWHLAVVRSGDCLYLPQMWLHHVRSHDRNLGVNLWWTDFQYNSEECSVQELPEFAPLANYKMTPELQLKQGLLIGRGEDGIIHASDIHQTLLMRQGLTDLPMQVVIKMFDIIKPGCQGQLLSSDLYSIPVDRFVSAYEFFVSSVQSAPEEGEGEGWGDEGGEWGGGGWEEEEGGDGGEWGYSELSDEEVEEEGELEGGGDFPYNHKPHDEL